MSLLDWQPGKRTDRAALRTFCCTDAPKRAKQLMGPWRSGPAEHERRVQTLIREHLAPAGDQSRTALLGWSTDRDLGGVASYRQVSSSQYLIEVIAVALRHRHVGGGVAREALATTLDYLTADAVGDGYSTATVGAKIHQQNRPCQTLFTHEGFAQTADDGDGYQVWSLDLLLDESI